MKAAQKISPNVRADLVRRIMRKRRLACRIERIDEELVELDFEDSDRRRANDFKRTVFDRSRWALRR